MSRRLRIPVLCAIAVLLLAGASVKPGARQSEKPDSSATPVQCMEPRPQICTMEYIPVCATLRNGTRRTYSSGCTACADPNVTSYQPDRCE